MSFWKRINPRLAVNDFAHEWKRPNPYRWRVLALSVATTFAILILFIPDSKRIEPRSPEVTWVTGFAPDRTDEEIIASNIENQKRKDEREKLLAERAEARREAFRELGRATFVDVDELERDIARQDAEAERLKQAAGQSAAGDE